MKKGLPKEIFNIFLDDDDTVRNKRKTIYFLLFSLLVVTFLLFLRRPDAFYNPQFWAEDGLVFFSQAHHLGIKSLTINYAGYYHTLLRITALIVDYLPVKLAPYFYNYYSLLVIYFIIIYLFSDRIKIKLNDKVLMSLFIVIAPLSSEVFMNLANTITVIAVLFLLLIISEEPVSKGEKAFDIVLLIVIGLSTVYTILVLPLFIIQLFYRKSRHFIILTAIAVLLAGIQTKNFLSSRIIDAHSDENMTRILEKAISKFSKWIVLEADIKAKIFFAGFVIVIGIYIFLLIYSIKNKKKNALVVLIASIIVLAAVLVFKSLEIKGMSTELEGRYQYIPIVTFLWTLVLLRKENKFLSVLFYIFLVANIASFLMVVTVFKSAPFIDYKWKYSSNRFYTENFSVIPLNPSGWSMMIQSKKDLESTGLRINYTNIELLKKELAQYATMIDIEKPATIIKDSKDNIYFINQGNEQVLKFDQKLNIITNWPKYDSSFSRFNDVQGLAIDSKDNIYIVDSDSGNGMLRKFNLEGRLLEESAKIGNFMLNDIAIDDKGNIYIADTLKDCIKKYNANLELVSKLGSYGEGGGQFNNPMGLAIDKLGNIYVSDTENFRIQKFDSKFKFLKEWGRFGDQKGEFDSPAGIYIDQKDILYVADQNNNRIQAFDLEGNYLSEFTLDGKGSQEVFSPVDIVIDSNNNYFVTDSVNNKVYKLDKDFNILDTYKHLSYIVLD